MATLIPPPPKRRRVEETTIETEAQDVVVHFIKNGNNVGAPVKLNSGLGKKELTHVVRELEQNVCFLIFWTLDHWEHFVGKCAFPSSDVQYESA